jgi:hypothetical protein
MWSTYFEAAFLHEYEHLPKMSPGNLIEGPHAAFRR